MKKIHLNVFVWIVSMLLFLSGCVATPQRISHQIVVQNSSCERLVSIENDGSMPKECLTQRYEVVCEDRGGLNRTTLEITVDKEGKIKETKIIDSLRVMGGHIQVNPMCKDCEEGEELRCRTECYFPLEGDGEPQCIYICWCVKKAS